MVNTCFMHSQVAIGKTLVDGDGILDFGNENMCLILPWVDSANTVSAVGGTLIFDSSDNRVKYFNGTNWIDLSTSNGVLNTSSQNALIEIGDGTVIGSLPATATGILVLESNDKALILPKIANPTTTLLSPAPGSMVYDTVSKKICIYNGEEWSFWGI